MPTPILTVKNLTKVFKSGKRFFFVGHHPPPFTAVDHISFHLYPGEILGLLGPNGAGKTTTIQMLLSTLKPTEGNILYFNKELKDYRSELLKIVSHASAYNRLPNNLNIQEALDIFGRIYGLTLQERRERTDYFLEKFGLKEMTKKLINTLSSGQMTRLVLAKAFLPFPKIVLLDEPTSSLDPDIAQEVREFIVQQQREFNVSMIITSHNMTEVSEICDRALVMQHGKIIAEDAPHNLASKIAHTKVTLRITEEQHQAERYLNDHKFLFTCKNGDLSIEAEESQIAQLLASLANLEVLYSHISIEKPSLEDYFLQITHPGRIL